MFALLGKFPVPERSVNEFGCVESLLDRCIDPKRTDFSVWLVEETGRSTSRPVRCPFRTLGIE